MPSAPSVSSPDFRDSPLASRITLGTIDIAGLVGVLLMRSVKDPVEPAPKIGPSVAMVGAI